MKKKAIIAIAAVVIALAAGIGVYAATNYGSQTDPLVAKSYLDEVLLPELEEMMGAQLDSAIAGLEDKKGTDGIFETVTLESGQTLRCGTGTELLLRSGSATASGGLANTTSGTAVSSGASLSANHLYIVSEPDAGLRASGSVTVLVKGLYSIG